MVRWLCVLVSGGVLSGFAFLLVTGEYFNEGPVVATLTRDHGVHEGDVFVLAGWAVGMLALLLLALAPSRRRAPEPVR